jgi:hypothetical protein
MAIDIIKAKTANVIKNGSAVVTCSAAGFYSLNDEDALNTPTIAAIQEKYTNRFDNPSYYYGGGGDADGGFYGEDVDILGV